MQSTASRVFPLSQADTLQITKESAQDKEGGLKLLQIFGEFPGNIHWCSSEILHKLVGKITSVSGGYIAISMEREGEITHFTPFSEKKSITRKSTSNPVKVACHIVSPSVCFTQILS